jgi:flagellar biosynthetic protein FliR
MATVSSAPGVDSAGALALAMAGELALGGLAGMVVRVALAAAEIAGEIAGMQMGFGFARTVNPLTAQQTGALTRLVSVAAGILFFAIGAHRQVIQAVADSLRAVPAGAAVNDQAWSELLVDSVSGMFVAGLRIALPLVVTVMASHLTFGLLSRVAPQLNLWSVGFLVSISVGLVGLTVFAPALVAEIRATLSHGIATALGAARM